MEGSGGGSGSGGGGGGGGGAGVCVCVCVCVPVGSHSGGVVMLSTETLLLVIVATFEAGVVVGAVTVDWHVGVKHRAACDFV